MDLSKKVEKDNQEGKKKEKVKERGEKRGRCSCMFLLLLLKCLFFPV